MADRMTIGIGIRIDDINKTKSNLQTELNNIKGIKANIESVTLNKAQIQSSIQTQLNGMNFTISIGKVDASGIDNVINKTKQATNEASKLDAKFASIKSKMQGKLSIAIDNKFIDPAMLTSLQTKLNSINTKTPISEIQALQQKINGLSSSDNMIVKLKQTILTMGQSLAGIKGNTNSDILGLTNVKGQVLAYETQLTHLKTILQDVIGGKSISSSKVANELNTMNNASKNLSTTIQNIKTQADGLSVSLRNALQTKLSTAFNNGFINTSFLTDLQVKLNGINANSPREQINLLVSSINSLGKSDSNIVKLQRTITNLSNEINKIKSSSKMDLLGTTELGRLATAQSELSKLRQTMISMQSGKVIDGTRIGSEVNVATNSINQLKNAVNSVKTSSFSLGGILKSAFSYAIGGSAIFATFNQIKEGISWVKYLDESFTDMAITMDITRTQFDKMSVSIDDMSKELGVNAKDVHDIAKLIGELI